MRNLIRGLVHNFHEDIDKAAFFLRDHVYDKDTYVDTGKKGALEILQNFESELRNYITFRLEKPDMQEIGKVLCEYLGEHDPKYEKGKVDTRHGNESLALQTGVVMASIISNQKMLRAVREHNTRVARYLNEIYRIFTLDPGDKKIEKISKEFVKEYPIDADIAMGLLERLTQNFTDEVERIPEDEDYFTRHIFKTGFVLYPGIGYEIDRLLPTLKELKR
ncbi:hypothetical protein HZA33_03475 [Candidatus Pacearchaeota archaeon]|nr:hypothetical protein [Candidatus Pacearchaeota archaeon]